MRAQRCLSSIMSSVNWWTTNSFCGQLALADELSRATPTRVDVGGVDRADHLARDLPGADMPLGVEREADVRLAQPRSSRLTSGRKSARPGWMSSTSSARPCARRAGSGG